MNWKTITSLAAASAAVLTFLGGATAYTYRAVGNNPMPLEGQKEHAADNAALKEAVMQAMTQLGNDIKADNLERRIEATCAMLTAARNTKATTMVLGLQAQLAGYQILHRQFTGAEYFYPMCE